MYKLTLSLLLALSSLLISLLLRDNSALAAPGRAMLQNLPTPITVLEVDDGDTELVKFTATDAIAVLRNACIDAPEVPHSSREKLLKNPIAVTQFKWGKVAKAIVAQWLKAATSISATIVDYDMRYGRNVAQVLVDGEDLGLKLVQSGYAYTFPKYLDRCANASALTEAQELAREQKLGIHSEPVMVPDEFRKAVAKMQ